MADPVSLSMVGMAASGGGSILSAFGAQQSGQAQSQMYQYQAGIAQLNSKIALQNRDYALGVGEQEAQKYGMGAAQRQGTIRAGAGASGIDVGSGSKADVQSSQQLVTGIDMATIRNNAARKAYGYTVEATQDTAQAGLYNKAASDASSAGNIKALGSLLSGSASVSDKWLQGSSSGLFGSSTSGSSSSNDKPTSNYYG